MPGGVILTLDGVGVNRQTQGGAHVGLVKLAAHQFHLSKEVCGGFPGLEDRVKVVIAVPAGPVGGIDVHFQTFFGIQGLIAGSADQLHPEIEGVGADIFDAHLLGDDIAGDDENTLGGEIGAVGGFFVDLQADTAGGHHIGGFANRHIVSQRQLRQNGHQNRRQSDQKQLALRFQRVSSFQFLR